MKFGTRRLCGLILCCVALGACQTTGLNAWQPKNPAATNEASSVAPDTLVGGGSTSFEISQNPYAYENIPPGQRPLSNSIEGGIWYTTDKIESRMKTSGNRVDDPELKKYLSELVCRVAGPYCPDIRVYVERNPLFNASMYPNGMMNIHTGFLLRVQSEAQVVAVIGHEIGHYIRRHGLQRTADLKSKADFLTGFSMLMGAAGIPVASDIAQLVVLSSINSFSRDNEREADLIGINLMARYGYDTRQASAIWRQLIQETNPDKKVEDVSTSTPFASSHPSSAERMNTLETIASELQGPGKWGSTGKDEFDRVVGPWKFRFLEDEVRAKTWKSTLVLLTNLKDGGYDAGQIYYFQGEVFRNRNRKEDKEAKKDEDKLADKDRAIAAYEASVATGLPPPQVYRSLGLLYHRHGDEDKARKNLLAYLELQPNANDALMIRYVLGQPVTPTS